MTDNGTAVTINGNLTIPGSGLINFPYSSIGEDIYDADSLCFRGDTTETMRWGFGASEVMRLATTGLTVTGAVSASGTLTTSGLYNIRSTGDLDTTGTAYISLQDNSTGTWTERGWIGYGAGNGNLAIVNSVSGKNVIIAAGGTNTATVSSTGVAITGGVTTTSTVTVKNGSVGYINVESGGASNSGYVSFFSAGAVRQGYIGYSSTTAASDTGTIPYVAGTHAFTGAITATGTITANFSDDRLKNRLVNIASAVSKVKSLNGFFYEPNETAQALGYKKQVEVGVSAQEVEKILPQIVVPAPIDPQYKTVHYEKLIPLLIEAIKEQAGQIEELKSDVEKLKAKG